LRSLLVQQRSLGLGVERMEGIDLELLQCDVLRRSQRADGAEEPDFALAQPQPNRNEKQRIGHEPEAGLRHAGIIRNLAIQRLAFRITPKLALDPRQEASATSAQLAITVRTWPGARRILSQLRRGATETSNDGGTAAAPTANMNRRMASLVIMMSHW